MCVREREKERHKNKNDTKCEREIFNIHYIPHRGLYSTSNVTVTKKIVTKNETSRELHHLPTLSPLYTCTQMCMCSYTYSYTLPIHNNHFIVFDPYISPYKS